MKLGLISYVNTLPISLPFQLGIISTSSQFIYSIPTHLNQMLYERRLDIALTSSVEYLDRNYRLIPHLGIASGVQVLSVNLYTRFPINQLHGVRIGLTPHSATSVSLLKVLCRHFWNISPLWENTPLPCYDAFLLIGDEALKKDTIPGFQTVDLATAWNEMTNLPFVFAVFLARNEIDPTHLNQLQSELERAIAWSEQHLEEVVYAACSQCTVSLKKMRAYYAALRYRLGEKEMESLELFRKLRHDV